MNPTTLVCTGKKIILPGRDAQPATLTIDVSSGKIIAVQLGHVTRPGLVPDHVRWVDADDKIVLPGVVEFVALSYDHDACYEFMTLLAPMSTSTNPVAHIGKVSGRGRVPPCREGSRPLWICP
jgi:hypothetical protein